MFLGDVQHLLMHHGTDTVQLPSAGTYEKLRTKDEIDGDVNQFE